MLQIELKKKGIVQVNQLKPISKWIPSACIDHNEKFVLWRVDITTLDADVIVNALNKWMLGCRQPLHACIDNDIHSAAGRDFEMTIIVLC